MEVHASCRNAFALVCHANGVTAEVRCAIPEHCRQAHGSAALKAIKLPQPASAAYASGSLETAGMYKSPDKT